MKYLFVLLFLVSCIKKDDIGPVLPVFEVGKCYEYSMRGSYIYWKVLKVYNVNSINVERIYSDSIEEKIYSNLPEADLVSISSLSCEAYEDQKEIVIKNQKSSAEIVEDLKRIKCDCKKEEST